MALIASSSTGWIAFAWGPALGVYHIESKQYTALESVPPPSALAAAAANGGGKEKDGDSGGEDEPDTKSDNKKSAAAAGAAAAPATTIAGPAAGAAAPVMHVRVIKFSSDGAFLVSGGDDKVVYVWRMDIKNKPICIATHVAKKRIAALTFVPGATPTIMYADRIGDCSQFSVPSQAVNASASIDISASTPVMGHLAAMTDLVFTPTAGAGASAGTGFVLSSDDEAQVRVSHFPQLYNIQSFCLHHRGFIHCVSAIDDSPLAVSGGGDAQIALWNILTGARIATHSFAAPAAAAATTTAAAAAAADMSTSAAGAASATVPKRAKESVAFGAGAGAVNGAAIRYVSSMAYSATHRLLAVSVNAVSAVYLFRASTTLLTLIDTLQLPTQTSGVNLCWSGARLIVATRRTPSSGATDAVTGVDPLLTVFQATAAAADSKSATAAAAAAAPRFVVCESKSNPAIAQLNARFAELMASAPAPADLVGDEYAKRERVKTAKVGDAKLRKDERVQRKRDKKQRKKNAKQTAADAAAGAGEDDDDGAAGSGGEE